MPDSELVIPGLAVCLIMETNNLTFKARLPLKYKEELTDLFYFNKSQSRYAKSIGKVVAQYGEPVIVSNGNFISLELKSGILAQSLFLLADDTDDAPLIGALIYIRNNSDSLHILQLTLNEKATNLFAQQGINLMLYFIEQMQQISFKIKDITKLILPYSQKIIRIRK